MSIPFPFVPVNRFIQYRQFISKSISDADISEIRTNDKQDSYCSENKIKIITKPTVNPINVYDAFIKSSINRKVIRDISKFIEKIENKK